MWGRLEASGSILRHQTSAGVTADHSLSILGSLANQAKQIRSSWRTVVGSSSGWKIRRLLYHVFLFRMFTEIEEAFVNGSLVPAQVSSPFHDYSVFDVFNLQQRNHSSMRKKAEYHREYHKEGFGYVYKVWGQHSEIGDLEMPRC